MKGNSCSGVAAAEPENAHRQRAKAGGNAKVRLESVQIEHGSSPA
jgi:hypothetical protein